MNGGKNMSIKTKTCCFTKQQKEEIYLSSAWIPDEMEYSTKNVTETEDNIVTVGKVYGKLLKDLYSAKDKNMHYACESMKRNKQDILQAGNLGLCKAIDTYRSDNSSGASFNTYASTCIRNEMIQENKKILKVAPPDILSSLEGFKEEHDGMEMPLPKEEVVKSKESITSCVGDPLEDLAKMLRDISIVDRWNDSEKIGLEWIIAHILYQQSGEEFIKKNRKLGSEKITLKLCQEYADKAKRKLNNEVYFALFKSYAEKGSVLPKNSIVDTF